MATKMASSEQKVNKRKYSLKYLQCGPSSNVRVEQKGIISDDRLTRIEFACEKTKIEALNESCRHTEYGKTIDQGQIAMKDSHLGKASLAPLKMKVEQEETTCKQQVAHRGRDTMEMETCFGFECEEMKIEKLDGTFPQTETLENTNQGEIMTEGRSVQYQYGNERSTVKNESVNLICGVEEPLKKYHVLAKPEGNNDDVNWRGSTPATLGLCSSTNVLQADNYFQLENARYNSPQVDTYRCKHCGFSSKCKKLYTEQITSLHLREHDYGTPSFLCTYCNFKVKRKAYLIRQVKQKPNAEVYQCTSCEYRTNNKAGLMRHVKRKHDADAEAYKCDSCQYKAKGRYCLMRHIECKHDADLEVYKCDSCQYKTNRRECLMRHVRRNHDVDAEMYRCKFCNYNTKMKSSFNRHVKHKHGADAEFYQCVFCKFNAKVRDHFERHMKCKHDIDAEVFRCNSCDYEANSEGSLIQHVK